MKITEIRNKLIEKELKVTPQRIAILEAIIKLHNHPTAENIIDYIRNNHPNIATATVYKVLDALASNELIKKVKTERDVMRYDAVIENHHHLYCSESDRIEDYTDNELNELLEKYFETKGIPDFKIEDIKLQIIGKFTKTKK
ncbi:MAG: transcriptional repressor [Bacteroidales bacterium]|jgi:Fur family peroxide stress response transcriptional regulator|nr:transcriptional repressor [Bacteroidales bacterium]